LNTPVDVLIPTYNRPEALAVTLTSLCGQTFRNFRVVISDQTETSDPLTSGIVQAAVRVLRAQGRTVEMYKHLPRRGMAEHRQFLLDQATAPYALFVDDDVILEPVAIRNMLAVIQEEKCGFVGCALVGLSFQGDIRPHQEGIEFWAGAVHPEVVRPGTPEWDRHLVHNAANIYHIQTRLGLSHDAPRKYKIAWSGGCTFLDTAKARAVGGFRFWRHLPNEHAGEDVLLQLRIMARYGACGIIPTVAYHQELPTTIEDRRVDAPHALELELETKYAPTLAA
jgi:GT2 family glycosyltransferase